MDFERLERAWRSDANTPTAAAVAYLTEDIMHTLQRRRGKFRTFLGLMAVLLSAWTGMIAWNVVADPFPFDLAGEWSVLVLLALPWIALVVAGRLYARHRRAHPDPYASTADTLRALIDENAMAQRRFRFMAAIMAIGVVGLAVALGQLVSVGKMTPQNVRDGAILFGVVLTAVWSVLTVNYFNRLRPEGERLKRLLAQYAEEGA
ncbi:MAG TPA: hypothetical protein VEA15_02250 [Caulobacteraceae bacterium]|nr:hypothetical protein [Caulobacteraceae bacterium]